MNRPPPVERLISPLPETSQPIQEPPGRIRLERAPSPTPGSAPRWRVYVDGRPADN